MSDTKKIITIVVVAIAIAIGIAAAIARRSHIKATEDAKRADAVAGRKHAVVTWEGREFHSGDRIRITHRAGTFKPEETKFAHEVEGTHQTGIVLAGERRTSTNFRTIDPHEPIQIVRVKWDAQRWKVFGREEWAELPQFDATIHVSYLEHAR